MILFVDHDGHRESYVLSDTDSFEQVFQEFPATRTVAATSSNFAEAAERIASYLSKHHMDAWVEDGSMSKAMDTVMEAHQVAGAAKPAPQASAKGSGFKGVLSAWMNRRSEIEGRVTPSDNIPRQPRSKNLDEPRNRKDKIMARIKLISEDARKKDKIS